ncbi:MAG: hypothetical protein PF495_03255 [Spirochaetales bacterium]|nr:hypothetical protein [Spirochaetales bacterium]
MIIETPLPQAQGVVCFHKSGLVVKHFLGVERQSEGSGFGMGGYNKYLKVFISTGTGGPDKHTVGVGKGLTMMG